MEEHRSEPAPRKYPDELRERAIREVQTSGRPVAHVARDLGIHKEALRNWVRQAEADQGSRPDLLTSTERTELTQLRKEIAELRRANEILKAASVFFAKELDQMAWKVRSAGSGAAPPSPSHPLPGRRTWSTGASPPTAPTSCGSPTSPISAPGRAGSTSPSSWTCTHG
ncbi:transposase [Streptomyces fildesensis]|uniref:transposase n=1 Tax=Streptomyces fildesensis TaxID=375757 RepID=UPI0034D4B0F7